MKVSLNWLKEYVGLPAGTTTEEICRRLTFSGLEIEGVEKRSKGFEKIFIGQILERNQHPNADKLSLCKVTVGTALSPSAEVLEIVCGAQNIKVGDRIPVATLGAIIPNGLEIKAAKIRGVASCGMLCSHEELLIDNPQKVDGIFIQPMDAPIGKNFAEYLGLDDEIIEVNVTPNRGDCLSHIGVARELAGLFGVSLKIPEVVSHKREAGKLTIHNHVGEECPVYLGRRITGVKVGASPEWLKKRIESIGLRSISNVVDATSFVLWECGQPMHAFDAAKVTSEIFIKKAREGETFAALTSKELTLNAADLVIATDTNGQKTVALAGVVGGANSEVSDTTTEILLECAEFHPTVVRHTNRRLVMFTDAAARFERGVDSSRIEWALNRATDLILKIAGGTVLETAASRETEQTLAVPRVNLRLRISEVQKLLGRSPDLQTTMGILRGIGIGAEVAPGEQNVLSVSVPHWRRDLRRTVDLIEEVGRLWGYDKLEARLPINTLSQDESRKRSYFQIRRTRRHLTSLGFSEALNMGFTSEQELQKIFSAEEMNGVVKLSNPLSEDFALLKPSLLSGLLRNVSNNIAHKQPNIRLFEIRRGFRQKSAVGEKEDAKFETGVTEKLYLSMAMTGLAGEPDWSSKQGEVDFFSLKGVLESVLGILGKSNALQFESGTKRSYLHPYQSAEIVQGKRTLGCIGRVHPRVEKRFDIEQSVYVLELELESLIGGEFGSVRFKPFSKFPLVERDFSATVPNQVNAQMIRSLVGREAKTLIKDLQFFDVYTGSRVPEGHTSYAFRIVLGADDHTLTDKEISDVQEAIMRKMASDLKARFAGQ